MKLGEVSKKERKSASREEGRGERREGKEGEGDELRAKTYK